MNRRFFRVAFIVMSLVFSCLFICACTVKGNQDTESKMEAFECEVCVESQLPDELREIIEEKKDKAFNLTYRNNKYLFIVVGYGEKDRSNYFVGVRDICASDRGIYVSTELMTDKMISMDVVKRGVYSRYPYIVLRSKVNDLTVFFD